MPTMILTVTWADGAKAETRSVTFHPDTIPQAELEADRILAKYQEWIESLDVRRLEDYVRGSRIKEEVEGVPF